jgi:GT2 family glycosyltransferase
MVTAMANTDAEAVVLLNNDVRLSPGFVDGLYDAWQHTKGAIVGPVYDHNWPHQRVEFHGPAGGYVPAPCERRVPFVDGTCMLVSRRTVEAVGLLDVEHWPAWSWGCDKDYCLRAREAGGHVFVTTRAYLSHFARATVGSMPGFSDTAAERENDAGMIAKWGCDWRDRLYKGFDHYAREGLVQQRLRH